MNACEIPQGGYRRPVQIGLHWTWPGWLRRAVREENVLLFLLGVRWLSLLPPTLMLLLDWRGAGLLGGVALGYALTCNVALGLWHAPVDRALEKRPWLLGADLLGAGALLAFTGGSSSPYGLYALTPVLAAAFFFGLQGGLAAALTWAMCYAGLGVLAHDASPLPARLAQMLGVAVIALAFGYSSVLLHRLRAANDELHHAHDDLQRITGLAALGKTTAHLSHEIRNPLATLGGFARQLNRNPDDTETVRHHAQVIAEECARLEKLLNDVLLVTRPPHTRLRPANLHEMIDRACLLSRSAGVVIVRDYADEMPQVPMNEPALLRTVLNIMRNAVQAMEGGGSLHIKTGQAHESGAVTVAITDSGPGLPPELGDAVFDPFVTGREHGTGLGLAIARHVVEEHGGTLEAANAAGGGACFTITLPLRQADAIG